MVAARTQDFISPFEVETPKGCEGWEEMYPSYYLFSEDRREFEEDKLWVADVLHHPEPMAPFDLILPECWQIAVSQFNTRLFPVPSALGIDHRVINGYVYISGNLISDEALIEKRKPIYEEQVRYYYDNWEVLYRNWKRKIISLIKELESIEIKSLPEIDDENIIYDATGISSGFKLIEKYNRLIESMFKAWQYHSEMANIGYAAYLAFMDFCKKAFPEIDELTVSNMIAGLEIDILKPDAELKKLARLALELKIDKDIEENFEKSTSPENIVQELRKTGPGTEWVERFEEAREPWFHYSVGMGNFYRKHVSWNDDLTIPFRGLVDYIKKARAGEKIERPLEELQEERIRISEGYRDLISEQEDKNAFDQLLDLGRTVGPFLENHVFYVEHWHHCIFWNKIRQIGDIFVENKFLEDREQIMCLHHSEIGQALYELVTSWAVGTDARAPHILPDLVKRREEILERLKEWTPLPAVGKIPEKITDPYLIMDWGITSERLKSWSATPEKTKRLEGFPASKGVREGKARVIRDISKLSDVLEGEILVCPTTSPSWGPVFSKIQAVVTDLGGSMAHAAIIAREYKLPAVVGTGTGTSVVSTGDTIRVDGAQGIVEIL
jgi:pyruvate,water dikinase